MRKFLNFGTPKNFCLFRQFTLLSSATQQKVVQRPSKGESAPCSCFAVTSSRAGAVVRCLNESSLLRQFCFRIFRPSLHAANHTCHFLTSQTTSLLLPPRSHSKTKKPPRRAPPDADFKNYQPCVKSCTSRAASAATRSAPSSGKLSRMSMASIRPVIPLEALPQHDECNAAALCAHQA